MRDPKLQAFLEDLVAVYVKHGVWLEGDHGGNAMVAPLSPSKIAVGIEVDADHEEGAPILFLTENTREHSEQFVNVVAYVPFSTTAHARLQAAARVAALRDEVTS